MNQPAKSISALVAKAFLALVPLCVIIACVNYFSDPGELFFRRHLRGRIVELILQGHNVQTAAVPSDWGGLHVELIRGLIAHGQVPEVAVFGTSRSSEICQSHFLGKPFFNHSIPGGSVLDYVALYAVYKEHKEMPRNVIISIDPWSFCARTTQYDDNKVFYVPDPRVPLHAKAELETHYLAGLRDLNLQVPAHNSLTMKWSADFRRITNLFSLTYFQSALRGLRQMQPQQTSLDASPGAFILRRDGSYTLCPNPSAIVPASIADEARRAAKIYGKSFLDRSIMRTSSVKAFEHLIEQLKNTGVSVALYLSPVHPDLYDAMTDARRSTIEDALVEICRRRNILVIGSFNPHNYGLDSTRPWFSDQYHPTRDAVDIVLKAHQAELFRSLTRNGLE